nr:EOG090X0755 [Sida crystallina]
MDKNKNAGNPSDSVALSLRKTVKGQLPYDRNPLTAFPAPDNWPNVRDKGTDRGDFTPIVENLSPKSEVLQLRSSKSRIIKKKDETKSNGDSNATPKQRSSQNVNSPISCNLSFEMMLHVIDLIDAASQNDGASNLTKKSLFVSGASQHAENMINVKRKELELRLVPQTDCQIEMDNNLQKRQEAARISRQEQNDQLECRLRNIQTLKEKERQLVDEENRKKKLIEQQRIDAHTRSSACINNFNQIWRGLVESINTCRDKESLIPLIQSNVIRMKELRSNFDSIIKSMHELENPVTGAIQGEEITKEFESISQIINGHVKSTNAAAAEREAAVLATQQQPSVAVTPTVSQQIQPQTNDVPPLSKSQQDHEADKKDLAGLDFVHAEQFKFYDELTTELDKHRATYAAIVNSKEQHLKQFKFDCQKAVNTPVNAISPVSASHLRDKLDKLRNLLSGNSVEVGDRRFSATQQPGGLEYVADLLARKFVRQGEDVVSSNPESAFAIAAVITALWVEFPTFGRLVLAHFYEMCPYLVPYYVPQQEGQSNQDYYKALGYQYTDGQIEKQDKFLKRMSGLVGLYAAVIISVPRQQQQQLQHSYGLAKGWTFLASVLNLPPRAEITATVLFHFLEVAGHSLSQAYGRQFQKLLHLLCTDYFAMIRSVTPDGCGGPVVRLDNFLQNAIKRRGISAPAGQLPANFW